MCILQILCFRQTQNLRIWRFAKSTKSRRSAKMVSKTQKSCLYWPPCLRCWSFLVWSIIWCVSPPIMLIFGITKNSRSYRKSKTSTSWSTVPRQRIDSRTYFRRFNLSLRTSPALFETLTLNTTNTDLNCNEYQQAIVKIWVHFNIKVEFNAFYVYLIS